MSRLDLFGPRLKVGDVLLCSTTHPYSSQPIIETVDYDGGQLQGEEGDRNLTLAGERPFSQLNLRQKLFFRATAVLLMCVTPSSRL